MKFSILLLSTLVGGALAACRNGCSAHGKCGLADMCECETRWCGLDCSKRECPFGVSWTTSSKTEGAPMGRISATNPGLGGMHQYEECSGQGNCDSATGECVCFEGYTGRGCRRQACPNDCSNNGRCIYNNDVNEKYVTIAGGSLNTQYWDAARSGQCECDIGFKGLDCSERMCPKGDDPMTKGCGANTEANDVQLLIFDQPKGFDTPGPISTYGYFSLQFTDMFNANYTTKPIYLGSIATDYSSDIESALESLPNFVTPNVTVIKQTYYNAGTALVFGTDTLTVGDLYVITKTDIGTTDAANWNAVGALATAPAVGDVFAALTTAASTSGVGEVKPFKHGHRYSVEFVDRHVTPGRQNLLQCSWAGQNAVGAASGNSPAAAPRGGSFNVNAAGTKPLARACTVAHQAYFKPAGMNKLQLRAVCDRYAGAAPGSDGFEGMKPQHASWWTASTESASKMVDDSCSLWVDHKFTNEFISLSGKATGFTVYKQNVECSDRGTCDTGTGLCVCYGGFAGDACSDQTTFF